MIWNAIKRLFNIDQPLTFRQLQEQQSAWANHNFDATNEYGDDPIPAFLGMVEELGEFAHALLKQRQGIRGTYEQMRAKQLDALGDLNVFMADVFTRLGADYQSVIEDTWRDVSQRDWVEYPIDGLTH